MKIFSFDLFGITIAPTWYGLMYALSFLIIYSILRYRRRLTSDECDSLLLWVFIAVIIGGRLGYVLFYNLGYFLAHPIDILKTWEGGMSFHGATIAVIAVIFLWSGKQNRNPFQVGDEVTSLLPIGLALGRIGNYINGELYGFAGYTGPFAIIHDGVSYFPSPLLEAFLEGVVLFLIVNTLYRKKGGLFGIASAGFLIGYGIIRFCIEFIRLPDSHIGYLFGTQWITLGQVLSLPLIFGGIILLGIIGKNERKD